jgi:membrane protease YdiL (CAAX protease family)
MTPQKSNAPEVPAAQSGPDSGQTVPPEPSSSIGKADAPQYSLAKSTMLHLAPGAVAALVYFPLVSVAGRLHLPALAALLFAVTCVLLPLELGHLLIQGKKLNGRWSLNGIVLPRCDWRAWRYLLVVPGLFILAIIGFALSAPIDRIWQHAAFAWLPAQFVFSDMRQYAQFSRSVLLVVFSVRLLMDGFLGPIVEELYFRGYLLPRMSRFGWGAPFINCALFSVYHFWQPYNLPTLFLVSLPMVIAVWKTKNVRVAIYTHILLNTFGAVSALIAIIHRA